MKKSATAGAALQRYRRWMLEALAVRRVPGSAARFGFAAFIFLLSFCVKSLMAADLAPVMYSPDQPAGGMAIEYDREAGTVLSGRGLLVPQDWDPSDFSLLRHTPGYPLVLSVYYRAGGRSYFTTQLFQNLLNSLTPVLIMMIASNLLGWRVGVIAGLLSAISHHQSYFSNFILPDSLCALPLVAAVYLLIRVRRAARPALWAYVSAGALIGLSVWLRPNALLFGPFAGLVLGLALPRRGRVVLGGIALATVPLLAVLPITIRNWAIYREFVPLTANTGIVLWEGIGDAPGNPFGGPTSDGDVIAREVEIYNDPGYGSSWSQPDGIRRDRDRVRTSLSIITRHPFWFSGVMIRRMGRMLKYSADAPLVYGVDEVRPTDTAAPLEKPSLAQPPRTQSKPVAGHEAASARVTLRLGETLSVVRPVARGLQRVAKETMQLFVALGVVVVAVLSVRRGILIATVPFYYLLFQSVTHTEFRYTLPMHHFLVMFSATIWVVLGSLLVRGMQRLFSRFAQPRRG